MNVYPYRTINSKKFTKYQINITQDGEVLVQHYFKNKMKSQSLFSSQNEVQASTLPKIIKAIAKWACYESKAIING